MKILLKLIGGANPEPTATVPRLASMADASTLVQCQDKRNTLTHERLSFLRPSPDTRFKDAVGTA
jgi:hypothetical protein